MSDSPAASATNVPVFTVSELSNRLKRTVEDAFGRVQVRGEISGFKRAASGHLYMSLKDSDAVMDAVCWRGTAGRMRFQPEDGLEVVCTGKLTTYAARSKYQLVIEHMEPAGVGALMALLEERRKKLAAEGLFDSERKRDLPYLPGVVGVVTSPTGAVIRDILHRLSDRFPRHVLLWPVLVQGEQAAAQVAAAIEGFNRLAPDGPVPRPDVLIVARGGGSIEDLWGFNEEIVVRAAAASDIPLISAVGHETDTTLIDLAADRRAPTPTAAAEIAVPVRSDLVVTVLDLQRRIAGAWSRRLERWRQAVIGAERGLRDPRDMVAARIQRLDDLGERLSAGLRVGVGQRSGRYHAAAAGLRPGTMRRQIEQGGRDVNRLADNLARVGHRLLDDYRRRLEEQTKLLRTLSYQGVLERGFAVVRQAGAPVLSAAAVTAGAALDIEFRDGHVDATAGATEPPAKPAKKPKPKPRAKTKKPDGGTQGSLL